ncbi:hypothetical protein GBZ26_03270 [Azospirillum formosense]|uniref:Uncharacterized protein n=1 Tax=Azospirillum formosense TaxID=861533 RepID=A0ABX2KS94_9PROT|nr:hypothetical protein [Azospirillum formosense]NUB18247.1 hypothetical protein [Azospirillum formosense]
MTPNDITAELVRRCIPADASPEDKAVRYRQILAAVKSAGRYAEPAWVLVRDRDGDVLAAFNAQVVAFRATAAQPTTSTGPRRGGARPSWLRPSYR